MARLSDYDCIGFDLDHTLVQYKLDNLYPVSQNCVTWRLNLFSLRRYYGRVPRFFFVS